MSNKTTSRYVNFYTDFAFKKLFGTEANKDLLIDFLNAMFNGEEVIEDIAYLNVEHQGSQEYDRRCVFDIFCKNNQGEFFIVEMQRTKQEFFKDRCLFYSTFAIREQAIKDNWNYELKGVYTIAILDFILPDYENDATFFHKIKLMDVEKKSIFYNKLTYFYLEMPKFKKKESELKTLFDKWMFAMSNLEELLHRPLTLQEKSLQKFFETAEVSKFNHQERLAYEHSLKIFRDNINCEAYAVKQGLEKGMKQGLEQGMKQGALVKSREMAKAMLLDGLSIKKIAAYSGLSEKEIKSL